MSSSPVVVMPSMIEKVCEDERIARRLVDLADLPRTADLKNLAALQTPFQAFEAFERWR